MKELLIAIGMMLLGVSQMFAANYYVSPTGSDNNPGTLSSPFATIMRAQQAASYGDVVYLRGGTYPMSNAQIASISGIYANVHTINKSGISYFAYSGETPVIDMSNVKPSGLRVVAFYVTADNCHFRGLEIIGTQVTITSHTVSYVFRVNNADNNTFERLNVHDGMATAVYMVGNSKNNLVLNCDAYNNWDNVSENGRGENTDGFGCHITTGGTGNVFRGCRAWFNSDDGFDCIGAEEKVTIDHCWAFNNGYSTSFSSLANGNGFKAGGYGIRNPVNPPAIIPRHLVQFCLAVRNKASGFYANHHLGGNDWYNNSAYYNGTNYNMLSAIFNSSSNTATDTDGYDHKMRNNLGYNARGTEVANLSQSASDVSYNYFTLGVSVTSSDFESLTQSLLTAPRQSDGSLPVIDFMKLVSGSDLIDKGQNIGEPYNGSSPDLGYFEHGGGCSATMITPYVQVDGGSWQGTSSVTINSGDEVVFGPQPVSGGAWSWTGCGTSGSSREQTINPTSSCTATATYTNSCGTQSSQTFNVTVEGSPSTTHYQFQNRATGLFLDGGGSTANGDPCLQYANTTHVNSHWELVDVGSGYYQLKNRGTGLYLDGMGRTNNGADCGQYTSTTHQNSHWSLQQYSGSYYRIQNRGTGLYLDGMGRTGNGDALGQWANTTSQNAQWQMITVSSGARIAAKAAEVLDEPETILCYPNPMDEVLNIRLGDNEGPAVAKIFNVSGQVVMSSELTGLDNKIEVQGLQRGLYFVEVKTALSINRSKLIKE